jgi:hypothetical protein
MTDLLPASARSREAYARMHGLDPLEMVHKVQANKLKVYEIQFDKENERPAVYGLNTDYMDLSTEDGSMFPYIYSPVNTLPLPSLGVVHSGVLVVFTPEDYKVPRDLDGACVFANVHNFTWDGVGKFPGKLLGYVHFNAETYRFHMIPYDSPLVRSIKKYQYADLTI